VIIKSLLGWWWRTASRTGFWVRYHLSALVEAMPRSTGGDRCGIGERNEFILAQSVHVRAGAKPEAQQPLKTLA
jgi:hypothetical protein